MVFVLQFLNVMIRFLCVEPSLHSMDKPHLVLVNSVFCWLVLCLIIFCMAKVSVVMFHFVSFLILLILVICFMVIWARGLSILIIFFKEPTLIHCCCILLFQSLFGIFPLLFWLFFLFCCWNYFAVAFLDPLGVYVAHLPGVYLFVLM